MPEVTLCLGVVEPLDEDRDLFIDLGDFPQSSRIRGGGEEGSHFGPDRVVDRDGDIIDRGREVRRDIGADGVGQGYGLQGENMREG